MITPYFAYFGLPGPRSFGAILGGWQSAWAWPPPSRRQAVLCSAVSGPGFQMKPESLMEPNPGVQVPQHDGIRLHNMVGIVFGASYHDYKYNFQLGHILSSFG